jgi:hypothetical protein
VFDSLVDRFLLDKEIQWGVLPVTPHWAQIGTRKGFIGSLPLGREFPGPEVCMELQIPILTRYGLSDSGGATENEVAMAEYKVVNLSFGAAPLSHVVAIVNEFREFLSTYAGDMKRAGFGTRP